MKSDCRSARALLAEGPLCKVEGCECGTVHVSFGPLTLRIRPEAVESIWTTLGDAIRAIHRSHESTCEERSTASKALLS